MAFKRLEKGKQIRIEEAAARVLANQKAKENAERLVREMKEAERKREEERGKRLDMFSLKYRNLQQKIEDSRNPFLKNLFKGKEKTKLSVLTRLELLKKSFFSEKTLEELLKTINKDPERYSRGDIETMDEALRETVGRNLKTIRSFEGLSENAKRELVRELARHSLFDEIISDSENKKYWIGEIIREKKLKELK